MGEQLWTAALTAAQLDAWLAPPRLAAPFAILERQSDVHFPAKDQTIVPSEWLGGRIFGDDFELRWERQAETYQVWLAGQGETCQASGFTRLTYLEGASSTGPDPTNPDLRCYLWGPGERRIARRLEYPALSQGGRPLLLRREFRNLGGSLIYYRFVRMDREVKQ